MKNAWEDPAKLPPKSETMNTPGDFKVFTDLTKRIVEKPKSDSPGSNAYKQICRKDIPNRLALRSTLK